MGIQINKDFRCINCGYKTDLGNTCLNCSEINAIDQLLVATDYNEPLIKKAIRYYKYNFIQELASPLSDIIIKYLKWLSRDRGFEIFDEDTIITAVPLVRRRRNWRGFNQSELIASRIADNFLINYDFNLFVRANGARSQAGIENRERRMANTIGRINITQGSRVHGRRVIVIDDVSTTGSTLNACATVLKDAGAKEVIGLVVARG
jgi:ComF family protein